MLNYPAIRKKSLKDSFVGMNQRQISACVKDPAKELVVLSDSDVISELVRRIDDQLCIKNPNESLQTTLENTVENSKHCSARSQKTPRENNSRNQYKNGKTHKIHQNSNQESKDNHENIETLKNSNSKGVNNGLIENKGGNTNAAKNLSEQNNLDGENSKIQNGEKVVQNGTRNGAVRNSHKNNNNKDNTKIDNVKSENSHISDKFRNNRVENTRFENVKIISPPQGFCVENITSDKFSFFRCIAKRLFDDQNSYFSILTKATGYIRKNPQIFNQIINNIPEYLKRVSENQFDDFIYISSALSYKFNLYLHENEVGKFRAIYFSEKFKITIYLLQNDRNFYLLQPNNENTIIDFLPMKYIINLPVKNYKNNIVESSVNSGGELESAKNVLEVSEVNLKRRKKKKKNKSIGNVTTNESNIENTISKPKDSEDGNLQNFNKKTYFKKKSRKSNSRINKNNIINDVNKMIENEEEEKKPTRPEMKIRKWGEAKDIKDSQIKETVNNDNFGANTNPDTKITENKADDSFYDNYSDYQSDMTNSTATKAPAYFYNYDSYFPSTQHYYSDSADGFFQNQYQDFMYTSFPNGYYSTDYTVFDPMYSYAYYMNPYDMQFNPYNNKNFLDFNRQNRKPADRN